LGVRLVSGLAQAISYAHQLDRRPFEIAGQALEVAAEILIEVG
jgi:hypothetical protein